jgi:hypothetical protein
MFPKLSLMRKPGQLLKKTKDSDDLAEQDDVDKLGSIKAFRTIITMVNLIPSQRKLDMLELKPQRSEEVQELRLLNALATLLVRSNEVAAVVVTKHGDGVVQVIACFHHDGSSAELTVPQSASKSSIFKNFLSVFNPRVDTKVHEYDKPHITDSKTSIPSNIQNAKNIEPICTYIYNNW